MSPQETVTVNQPASFAVQLNGARGVIDAKVHTPAGVVEECYVSELDSGGTWGHGDVGTQGVGTRDGGTWDVGTRNVGTWGGGDEGWRDMGTWGQGMEGHGDVGTRDGGTWECGDMGM